jgi:hypothetical protein
VETTRVNAEKEKFSRVAEREDAVVRSSSLGFNKTAEFTPNLLRQTTMLDRSKA